METLAREQSLVQQQNHPTREAWLQARRLTVGSSDAAALMGVSPFKSPYTLWAEKVGLLESSVAESEAARWGNILEPVLADTYTLETGRKLIDHGRHSIQLNPLYPFMAATLDREICPIEQREGPGVLELKTTGHWHAKEWQNEPPVFYQIQHQHQLAVTNMKWGSIAVLIGGQQFLWTDQERNQNFIDILIEREFEFMELVQREIPPEADGSESTAETLKDLYRKDSGEKVALPGITIEWDEKLTEIKESIKVLVAEKDTLENKLKAEIKDASAGILPNGIIYSLKTTERAGYTVQPTTFRALRRAAPKGGK